MSEEQKVQAIEDVVDADTAQKLGDASLSRIKMFSKMCKEYVRALNGGHINSLEGGRFDVVLSLHMVIASRSNRAQAFRMSVAC